MPLTRRDVIGALGRVDDSIVAQIIATGATPEQLAEARAWVVNDESMMNAGRPLAGGRVAALVDILARMDENEPDPESR
jgi:hypothetical protein